MKIKLVLLSNILVLVGSQLVSAQDDVRTPTGTREVTVEQVRKRNVDRRMSDMARISNLPRQRPGKKNRTMTKEELRRFKKATTPKPEDEEKYRTFLKQKNTGIFRMFSNFDCESEKVVTIAGECANYVPGTWAYSLRRKKFSNQYFHDIGLVKNVFVSRGLLSQSLIVNLGDVAIEGINLNSQGVDFLAQFAPAPDRLGAKTQFEEVNRGIEKDGYKFSNRAALAARSTFALRVIAYRMRDKWTSRLWPKNADRITKEEARFQGLEYDKRIDCIYVFRVVRVEDKGGTTILWKRLSKAKSPRLDFEEDEKLEDFGSKIF